MPTVSIIVPVYKAELLLKTCVDSALSQSNADLELILIDDGSPDRSGEICDEYAAHDTRVRVIHQKNGGVSNARNAGIGIAEGKYVLFLDSDDFIDKDFCKKMVGTLKAYEADIAGCANWDFYPDGSKVPLDYFLPAGAYEKDEIMRKVIRPMLRDRTSENALNGFVWRYLFSRSVIVENGISFCGAYLEDEMFLLEYLCNSQKLVSVQEHLYYYMQNPASVTKRYLRSYEDTFLGFLEAKRALVRRFDIKDIEGWGNSTLWAGLLIAIGNEFAPGNEISIAQKRKNIISLCKKEPFRSAIASGKPKGAGRRKKMVIDLISSKKYTLLTLLYAIKNRGR